MKAQQADEIGRVDQFAEPGKGGVDPFAALGRQPIGVILDPDPLAAAAILRHQIAQFGRRVGALAVGPDADVLDHRSEARLALVGRARQQGQGAVRPQIQALEHAVAAGVVAGQVIEALLAEDQETVEPGLRHLRAGAPLPRGKFLPGEMERHLPSPIGFAIKPEAPTGFKRVRAKAKPTAKAVPPEQVCRRRVGIVIIVSLSAAVRVGGSMVRLHARRVLRSG